MVVGYLDPQLTMHTSHALTLIFLLKNAKNTKSPRGKPPDILPWVPSRGCP